MNAPSFKYALLGASYCIRKTFSVYVAEDFPMDTFIPPHLMEGGETSREYWNRHVDLVIKDRSRRMTIHKTATGEDIEFGNKVQAGSSITPIDIILANPVLAPVKYVMELAGLDANDWSLSFSSAPIIHSGNFSPLISREAVLSLLESGRYNGYHTGNLTVMGDPFYDKLCHELGRRSLKALGGQVEDDKENEVKIWHLWEFWKYWVR